MLIVFCCTNLANSVYNVNFVVAEIPGNTPVEGATVNLSGTIRYTDDAGHADYLGYEPGTYNYSVTKDEYEAGSGTFDLVDADMTIDVNLLINSIHDLEMDNLHIYPNPVNGVLNVNTPSPCQMELLDISGRLVLSKSLVPGKNKIDLTNQKPGIYYLKLKGMESVWVEKVVIR